MTLSRHLLAAVSFSAIAASSAAYSATPEQDKLFKLIKQQQAQIEALQARLEATDKRVETTEQRTTAVADALDNAPSDLGQQAAVPGWWNRTSVGGYGELHYNNYLDDSDGKDEIDFHRFVLFFGHEFNDDIRMFSEFELEHALAGEGKDGEVELEQAFIEFDLTESQQARAGVFLLPVGLLNETHEPNTFFGTERNPVESNIIPTTWWEAGAGLAGQLGSGFSYDLALHSGLNVDTTGGNAFKIRNGRQKVSEAFADNGAATAALTWRGMPGVELGGTVQYQTDITQNNFAEDNDAMLSEIHADIRKGGYSLRALYARWDVDGATPESLGRDEQYGWYVEPSYRFDIGSAGELGFFARYNQYDNEAGSSSDTEISQIDVGTNYWPHPNVVLKADMSFVDEPTNSAEILNLGVGYQF